jgi:hypothetical protein
LLSLPPSLVPPPLYFRQLLSLECDTQYRDKVPWLYSPGVTALLASLNWIDLAVGKPVLMDTLIWLTILAETVVL